MKKISYYDLIGDKNPYEWVFEVAGAKVIAFETFGSYQGDWVAKVEYKGKIGWIIDSYGSCSGCDAFEAEAGYEDRTRKEWKEFCINFAKGYLEDMISYDEALKKSMENIDWDLDAKEIFEFIKKHKETL